MRQVIHSILGREHCDVVSSVDKRLFPKCYFWYAIATSFTRIIQTEHMSSFCEEFSLISSCQEFQLDYFSNRRLLVLKLFGFPDNPGSEDMRACMYPVNGSCTFFRISNMWPRF